MNDYQESVIPVNPAAPYMGGKRILSTTICSKINAIPHKTYAEPFVGMGGVFFRRDQKPRAEVINDINGDISNFFRVLQRHYISFVREIEWRITTRAEFERLKNAKPETLTDLERAARFIYLQRTAFGGKVSGQHFGVAAERPARFDITKLIPMLGELHERLAGVVIENLSYIDFIERYNKPYVLFYLDPPYWDCENDYGKNIFSKDDFKRLAKQLKNIKGSFILSLNDKPEVRDIFKGFYIESVKTNYSMAVATSKKVGEVLISNVDTANILPNKNAA